MKQDMINKETIHLIRTNKIVPTGECLRSMCLLLLMLLSGVSEAWGQPSVTLTTAQDVSDGTEVLYWIESFGATGFYMIPMGTNDNSGVSTSNMPNEKMLWYFMDANTEDDTENGRQYYYIVNKSTGKFMKLAGDLGTAP